jgi:imidazoleglycerol-phosphate dehydratase
MQRTATLERKTKETEISVYLNMDGVGKHDISTGIGFFDHMLELFAVHGFFDLTIKATGDIHVDFHHTVEDVGIVLGDAFKTAIGGKKGIVRYGNAVTPMDDALSTVTVDLSGRPFLAYMIPDTVVDGNGFNIFLAKEFFRAFSMSAAMNLHINVQYGENGHHVIESVFKSFARALDAATKLDPRITDVRSSKGTL